MNCCYILINYFLLTYKVGINYAPIINRINYLLENILCLKNDKIGTEIYLKSLRTKKKIKSNTYGLAKKIKRAISSNAINKESQNLRSEHCFIIVTYFHSQNIEKHKKDKIATLCPFSQIFFAVLHTEILIGNIKGVFHLYQKQKR